ncbi:MAG: hypothetical protein NVSMB18_24330 [Acetobacteraceae bacterium]
MTTTLTLDHPAPGVARIRLIRPEAMNTLTLELIDEFDRALVGSADWLEGMDAFVAKRPPRFGPGGA